MTLNDLSKSIYVINLKHREDRKVHIISELKKIECIEYDLIEAIDGNTIENKTSVKNGAYGLIKTYFNIYENWKEKKHGEILIIEDDCVFVPKFKERLEKYISNVPMDWDMLYFGANHNYHMGNKTETINEDCIKLNNSFSAHCILMKNHIFEELIHLLEKNPVPVDVKLSDLQKKYNAYSPSNKLTSQIPDFSNIENQFVDYNWLMK